MTRFLLAVLFLFGCDDPPRELPQVPAEAETEPATPEPTGPAPSFIEGAKVHLLRGSNGGWSLAWSPALVEGGEIAAYLILADGEEIARLDGSARYYDLGEVAEGMHLYTITALSEGNREASLDFTMPADQPARIDLMTENMREELPGSGLRFRGGG